MAATDHLNEQQFTPLPTGRDLFYRVQSKNRPLDRAHARSRTPAPWMSDHKGAAMAGLTGYSAFQHPQQLVNYMHDREWTDDPGWEHREVVSFHGKFSGRGDDNEPLAIPAAKEGHVVHERMGWSTFMHRAAANTDPAPQIWPGEDAGETTYRGPGDWQKETDIENAEAAKARHARRHGGK